MSEHNPQAEGPQPHALTPISDPMAAAQPVPHVRPPQRPMSVTRFVQSLGPQVQMISPAQGRNRARFEITPEHPDYVYGRLLTIRHKRQNKTADDWHKAIEALRNEPAHPTDPDFKG